MKEENVIKKNISIETLTSKLMISSETYSQLISNPIFVIENNTVCNAFDTRVEEISFIGKSANK